MQSEEGARAIARIEDLLDSVTSLHQECGATADWHALSDKGPPAEPSRSRSSEAAASERLASFRPNLLQRLFGREERARAKLARAVEDAKRRDEEAFRASLARYEQLLEEWQSNKELAHGILSGDPAAYLQVVEGFQRFEELLYYLPSINVTLDKEPIRALVDVLSDEVIPREKPRLLKSGTVSFRNRGVKEFHGLYQDYVCSASLRVARELLALLPVEEVIVTARAELLDTQTGHTDWTPIISVLVDRRTVEELNWYALDPSDAMRNFVHNMRFRITKGFRPVEEIAEATTRS